MENCDLTSEAFWVSSDCHVMVNPADPRACKEALQLETWVDEQEELASHLLFSTSGSTGRSKWVAISREALLVSAKAVNAHLGVNEKDVWLLPLPTFHVGGIGQMARAYAASCKLVRLEGKWNPKQYHDLAIQKSATFSSLVPTQLVDLVAQDLSAPPSLKGVLIGGGRLDDRAYDQARALGWPLIETYGMTETSSQIATSEVDSRELNLLPCWETRVLDGGRLAVRGAALASFYIVDGKVEPLAQDGGWFVTEDRVEIKDGVLKVLGRVDRCVKILGELVNLDEVQKAFPHEIVLAIPDVRRGARLVLCSEKHKVSPESLDAYHSSCHPLHRISNVFQVDVIPRSPLGKVLMGELTRKIEASIRG